MATSLRYPMGYVFLDNNGDPLASGTIQYYEAGTTTAEPIYSDAAGATALPNPITLNSAGRAVDGSSNLVAIYLSDAGATDYKEVVKDSGGTTIWTDDDIPEPVDPTASLTDTAKPRIQWSTDTDAAVSLTAGNLGGGRLADSSSNSITYAPISASTAGNGNGYLIKKTNASNTVTFDPDGSETVDGDATFAWTEAERAFWFLSDGANWRKGLAYLANSAGLLGIQVFTSTGTYTPTSGIVRAIAIVIGGGGGGGGVGAGDGTTGSAAGGGGAGGCSIEVLSASTIGASQAVTIGAAGAAGSTSGGTGGTGGTSSLGALLSGAGGVGGSGTANTANNTLMVGGGSGGAGSGGDVNMTGNAGTHGATNGTTSSAGGTGGASWFGGGAAGAYVTSAGSANGSAGTLGGGGGGAALIDSGTNRSGGAGGAGVVVVLEFGE